MYIVNPDFINGELTGSDWQLADRPDGDQSDGDQSDGHQQHGTVLLESKPEVKRPSLYRVILLNDDFTPMEFVVHILEGIFDMGREKATQVMLAVHTQGKGVCGVYTKDIAETKAAQVNQYSREHEHPLMCDIEQVDDE